MDTERILEALETLPLRELQRVKTRVDQLTEQITTWQDAEPVKPEKKYRQEWAKCSKPNCKTCGAGQGHGPYWYAFWTENGKTKKKYIGKHLKPE